MFALDNYDQVSLQRRKRASVPTSGASAALTYSFECLSVQVEQRYASSVVERV